MNLQQVAHDLQSSPLETKVVGTATQQKELEFFADVHNNFWEHFKLTPDILRERIDSGNLIAAAYARGAPLGFVQTVLREEDESTLQRPPPEYQNPLYIWKTAQICARLENPKMSAYELLTRGGRFSRVPDYGNVLWFLDINVHRDFWSFGIGSALIDFVLEQQIKKEIPQLKNVRYGPTLTPNDGTINFHLRKGAFDTQYVMKNARHGHRVQNARPACYIATDFTLDPNYLRY